MTADEFVSMVKFDERGLVPVVTQDISDNVVLMMAWADAVITSYSIHYTKLYDSEFGRQS